MRGYDEIQGEGERSKNKEVSVSAYAKRVL
jgi:hypothetical protein